MAWRLRADLVRVAVAPTSTLRQVRELWLVDEVVGGPYLGVVVQRGDAVRDIGVGQGVIFGAHVGEWCEGDLLMAERDVDAVLES